MLLERIVPAIRETRVPLIAGYIWLLVFSMAAARFTDIVELAEDEGSMFWLIDQILGVFNQFGLGVAVTITAFMTGSLFGFLWDRLLRPLDSRALRERPARLFTEAQFRYQIALPLSLVIAFVGFTESPRLFLGWIVPLALVIHARALWGQAVVEPLRADLKNADLSNAYLKGANCAHVDFTGANLQLADLTNADVSSAQFQDAQLDNAIFDDVNLNQIAPGLTATQLQQLKSLSNTNLTGVILTDANLTGANLTGVILTDANLTGVILTGANLTRANLARANLTRANLTDINLFDLKLFGVNIFDLELFNAKLFGANLFDLKLFNAKLFGVKLFGANLTGANLTGANLTDANLTGANLTGANLTDANLTDTNLTGANLPRANLFGTNFTRAYVRRINGRLAQPTWPEGFAARVLLEGKE